MHGRVCHRLTPCLHAHNNQVSAPILKDTPPDVIYTTPSRVWCCKTCDKGSNLPGVTHSGAVWRQIKDAANRTPKCVTEREGVHVTCRLKLEVRDDPGAERTRVIDQK